jgi:hypothetical protein
VDERLLGHQGAHGPQMRDDARVRVPHRLAAKVLDLGHEAAVVVDRVVDAQAERLAQVVVLLAVAGGDVHEAGAGGHLDERRRRHLPRAIDPRMPVLEAFEPPTGHGCHSSRLG